MIEKRKVNSKEQLLISLGFGTVQIEAEKT